jgi:hypothetical protein
MVTIDFTNKALGEGGNRGQGLGRQGGRGQRWEVIREQ